MKIFDFDGTLVDSNHVWLDVDVEFLARRGKRPTPEYTQFVSHSIYPIAARFTREYYGLTESEESIMADWTELAREAYAHRVPLKEGAADYLHRCVDRGETPVLFTAGLPELCRLALDHHGLTSCFSAIVFAQHLGLEKRDPRAFAALTRQLGVEPGDCVMFDDSPLNCLSAKTAGLTVVGVYDRFFDSVQDQVRANSHRYLRSFAELL